MEIPFNDGKVNGLKKQYYESGKIKTEIPFKVGKENGVKKEYYESGKIKTEIPFKDGKENGLKKQYDESGKIVQETTYKDVEKSKIDNSSTEIAAKAENVVYQSTHASQRSCFVEMEGVLQDMSRDSKVMRTLDEPNHKAAIIVYLGKPATVTCKDGKLTITVYPTK